MIRQLTLTFASLAILTAMTDCASARNLFDRQAGADVEALPVPAAPARPARFAPLQKSPHQATQKTAYQATQKAPYQKGATATCVRYVQHRPHRTTCCDSGVSYQTVLTIIDPKTCCPIDVPICLPACCTGPVQCSGRDGLFGRGITKFSWCCGYAVRVVVGHHGDVTVHYYGV